MQYIVVFLLFAFQIGAIIHARSVESRYFCWAPYDTQTEYTASSVVNGHMLKPAEFRKRYRRPMHGYDNRSPENVYDMFQGVAEERAKVGEQTTVEMKYHINGKDELHVWRWPNTPTTPPSQ
jgi:hypothetical protein